MPLFLIKARLKLEWVSFFPNPDALLAVVLEEKTLTYQKLGML